MSGDPKGGRVCWPQYITPGAGSFMVFEQTYNTIMMELGKAPFQNAARVANVYNGCQIYTFQLRPAFQNDAYMIAWKFPAWFDASTSVLINVFFLNVVFSGVQHDLLAWGNVLKPGAVINPPFVTNEAFNVTFTAANELQRAQVGFNSNIAPAANDIGTMTINRPGTDVNPQIMYLAYIHLSIIKAL